MPSKKSEMHGRSPADPKKLKSGDQVHIDYGDAVYTYIGKSSKFYVVEAMGGRVMTTANVYVASEVDPQLQVWYEAFTIIETRIQHSVNSDMALIICQDLIEQFTIKRKK